MQKISTQSDSRPPKNRPEAESYEGGVQTYMRVVDGCLTTERPKTEYPLLERILSPANLNAAYLQVKRNGGAAGVDRMDCDRLLGYLIERGEELKERIRQRTYRPNPVRRVDIPKDNGGKRQLGIPTVVDRMFQQAIAQVLTPSMSVSSAREATASVPSEGQAGTDSRDQDSGTRLPLCGGHRPRTLL